MDTNGHLVLIYDESTVYHFHKKSVIRKLDFFTFLSVNKMLNNYSICQWYKVPSLHWRHNGRDSVSNHQPHDYLLNRLLRRRSKKTSQLRVTGLCVGNSPGTGEFPAQMASNAENVSIWWRHHDAWIYPKICTLFTHCGIFLSCSNARFLPCPSDQFQIHGNNHMDSQCWCINSHEYGKITPMIHLQLIM